MPAESPPRPTKNVVCMLYVCMSGIIRRMVVHAPFGNGETRCLCSETKCNSYKHGLFRYTGGSDPATCVLRIYSKPSVRYCCWLWFHLTTNKQPVRIRKEGKRQPFIVVLESTMVYTYVYPASRYIHVYVLEYPAFPPSTLFHPRAVGSPVY